MKAWLGRLTGAVALGAVLFASVSCSNMQSVQEKPAEEAESQTFNAEFRKVVDTGAATLRSIRFVVTEITENDERATILFIRPGSFVQYGGVGRMVVEKSAAPPITVRLTYERRFALSYGAGEQSLAKNVFGRMEREIQFSGPKS
jgi:hypothetical protein